MSPFSSHTPQSSSTTIQPNPLTLCGSVVLIAVLVAGQVFAQAPLHPMLGPVPADLLQNDDCTSVVEVLTRDDFDVGYANLFYFFQNRHAFSTIATNDPANPGDVLTIPASSVAGAFVPSDDRGAVGDIWEFEWTDDEGNSILKVRSTATGETETIGETAAPEGTMATDLAWNPYSGTLWGYFSDCKGLNPIGYVNRMTGAFMQTGQIEGPTCMVAGTVLPGGSYLLGLDTEQDRLYKIEAYSPYTATPLGEIGAIGYSAAFMQSMDYSHLLGAPFIAAIHHLRGAADMRATGCGRAGAPEGQLRMVDLDDDGVPTGTTTLIGPISANGRAQAMYLAFPMPPVVAAEPGAGAPTTFELSEAYPNPIAPESVLLLELLASEYVSVQVYDSLGRRVAVLHEGILAGGQPHRLALSTPHLASGLYLFHVRGETFTATRKAVIQR